MKIETYQPVTGIWCAYDADECDESTPLGHGDTERAAINNLVEQLVEQERR